MRSSRPLMPTHTLPNATAMAQMYGYGKAEEIVGARLGDMLPADDPRCIDYLSSFIRNGFRLIDTESQEPDRDGNCRYFLNNLFGVVENGMLLRACGMQRDITEQKELEWRISESVELFRGLSEANPSGIFRADTESHVTYANAELLRIWQITEQEISGHGWIKRIHPDDLPDLFQGWIGASAKGQPYEHQYRLVMPDQTIRYVHGRSAVISDKHGKPLATVGTVDDITDAKHREQALQASEEKFRATFANAAVGMAHVAPDGRWLQVNERLCNMLGYSRDELIKKSFVEMTHPEDVTGDLNNLQKLLSGDIDVYLIEKRYYRKDDSILPVNLTVSLGTVS